MAGYSVSSGSLTLTCTAGSWSALPTIIGNPCVNYKLPSNGVAANCLARDDAPHSYTYTPDAADALLRLAASDTTWNQTWHLPTTPDPPASKAFIEMSAAALRVKPKYRVLGRMMLRLVGLFNPVVGEIREMLYQYDSPYLFDSSKYARAFGFAGTPYEEGIRQTANSYKV